MSNITPSKPESFYASFLRDSLREGRRLRREVEVGLGRIRRGIDFNRERGDEKGEDVQTNSIASRGVESKTGTMFQRWNTGISEGRFPLWHRGRRLDIEKVLEEGEDGDFADFYQKVRVVRVDGEGEISDDFGLDELIEEDVAFIGKKEFIYSFCELFELEGEEIEGERACNLKYMGTLYVGTTEMYLVRLDHELKVDAFRS